MNQPRATTRTGIPTRAWIDVAVLTVLSAIGLLGFAASFSDASYLLAGFGGLLVGTAAALLAAFFKFDIIVTTLLVIAAYFLFGGGFAMPQDALFGVIPTLQTLSGLAVGAVFGWADIVTLTTPVAAPDYIGVLPFVACWVVGIVTSTLAARWFVATRRTPLRSLVALLGPLAIYVTSVLTGTEQPYFAGARGVAFAVIALVWLAWRVPTGQNLSAGASSQVLRRKLLGVGAVALAAVIVGGTLGFASAPATEDRFVLRNEIEPPFDPLQYASPLSGFRKYTKDLADTVLFTVDGLQSGERIRLATMDSYDGKLWNVTGPDLYTDGSGSFSLIGRNTQPPSLLTAGDDVTLSVTIDAYKDVWLPADGYPTTIDFDSSAGLISTALRYNAATGIAAVTGGLKADMHYVVTAETQKIPTDAALAGVAVADVQLPPVSNVPDIVAAKATELAGKAATPIEQLRAIEAALHSLGYLSHGTASEQAESSAGHGAYRMKLLLERSQWIGDDEQYASVFALMARDLGYPARVVMGFAPEVPASGGTVEVTGADVRAWVEVAFQGVGWIPFYPTPDNTDIPQDQTPKPQTQPQPQVRQPPRSDTDQDDLVSAVELDDPDDDDDSGFQLPGWVFTVLLSLGIPAALYFIPLLIVAGLKRRRRARRLSQTAPGRRAGGAWDELVDTYAELGYSASRRETRVQMALSFEEQFREEIAARQRERASAADRAEARAGRAEARVQRAPQDAAARPALGSLMEATVIRTKETASWRPGVEDSRVPLPVLPGLREFAVASDRAVFSGAEVPATDIDALWAESETAQAAARRSVSWFRRQLSRFRIRPQRDVAEALAARFTSARTPALRGATPR